MHSIVLRLCCFSSLLWILSVQAEMAVQSQISGISDKQALVNTQTRMQQNIQNLPQPLTVEQIQNFYLISDEQIKAGVAPFSYFTPDVQKKLLQKTPTHWQMDYQVQLGEPARITAVQVTAKGEGAAEPILQNLLTQMPCMVGQLFISDVYDTYKKKLLTAAQSLGYIRAHFAIHEVLVDRLHHTVVISLHLNTGQRYYFGAIHFDRNPLSDNFLRRFVSFKTGQPFSNDQANQLQTNLQNSSYFSSVVVAPDLNQADAERMIPITMHLKPVPRQQYIFGLGYGTDTGPRATLGSDWHYLNAYGHRLNTLLRLSQVQSTASAKYIIPGNNPLTDEYNVNASLQNNDISQGQSTLKQVGVGYTFAKNHWKYSLSLSEQIERYSFFNNPYQTSHLLLPGANAEHIVRNDLLFPTEGHRFSVKLLAAKQGIASDTNLLQTSISEKWMHSFNDNHMILLRGDLGLTAVHDTNLLPLSLSFFAGGAQSIRGYGYNNLGPGRYMLVGSAEYRYRVYGKWYAATFFDLGNAFNNWPTATHSGFSNQMSTLYHFLNQGGGIGVVWNSPLGAMELTYAKELNVAGNPSRIQFNLGTDL